MGPSQILKEFAKGNHIQTNPYLRNVLLNPVKTRTQQQSIYYMFTK